MLKQDEGLKGIQSSIGRALAILPLTPNQWTSCSVALALIGALAVAATGDLLLGLALFVLAAFCDAIDGAVARARGETSAFGGFLDGVADRFVEAAFLFAFMFVPLPIVLIDPRVWIALAIFLGTCMPSFVRAYAEYKGAVSREKADSMGGLFERSERILVIVAGLAAGLLYSMSVFVYALILVSALSAVTIMQRVYAVSRK